MNFSTARRVMSRTWMTTSNVSAIFSLLISSFTIASQHRKLRCCGNNIVDDSSIEVGDIVFAVLTIVILKLDLLFFGPHRVNGHKVKILDIKTLVEQIVHVDHLKHVSKGFDDECAHQVSFSFDLSDPSSDSSLTTHTHLLSD